MKEQFQKVGYYIDPALIDPAKIAAAHAAVIRIFTGGGDITSPARIVPSPANRNVMTRIDQPHLVDDAIKSLVWDRNIAAVAAHLFGVSAVQVWYAHALFKPPKHERSHVGWHTDGQYADFFLDDFVTAWIPLCSVSIAGGTLTYVQGTHKQALPRVSGFSSSKAFAEQTATARSLVGVTWTEVPVTGSVGLVSFHHSRLLHGSSPNGSKSPRVSLTIHFRSERNVLRRPVQQNFVISALMDQMCCPVVLGESSMLDMP